MPDKNQDISTAWKGFDEPRRKSLLSKMTPEQKKNLRVALESPVTEESEHARQLAPTLPIAPGVTPQRVSSGINRLLAPSDMTGNDPNTLKGYAKTWGEALKGAGQGIRSMIMSPLPGTEGNPVIWNPAEQFRKDWAGVKDFAAEAKKNPNYAAGELVGPALLTHTLTRLLTPAGMAAKLTRATGVSDASMIENTANDLRTAAKGATPKTVGEFVGTASKAEKVLNDEYSSTLGKYGIYKGNLPDVDGNFPLSQVIKKLKDKYPDGTELGRDARKLIDKRASEFQRPVALNDLDRERINADARRYGLYGQSDVSQYAAKTASAEKAVDIAISDWVRDNVYPEMDQLTGKPPGYFRSLKQRIGNLMRVQSETKENAVKLHTEAMKERGSTRWERARPGASISQSGKFHTYLPNIPRFLAPEDPEAGANAAVRSGFSPQQRFKMPPEALSIPLSDIQTILNRGGQPAPRKNPTDEWAGTGAP